LEIQSLIEVVYFTSDLKRRSKREAFDQPVNRRQESLSITTQRNRH